MNSNGVGGIPSVPPRIPNPLKKAELEKLITEPASPAKTRELTGPGESFPTQHPKETIHSMATAQPSLLEASKLIQKNMQGSEIRHEKAREMAIALDQYVKKTCAHQIHHAVEKALGAARKSSNEPLTEVKIQDIARKVENQMVRRFNNALKFFVTVDRRKGPETPLERMCAPFENLTRPQSSVEQAIFDKGLSEYIKQFVARAFDQHFDNPEQYVSHGFDHSINVANYTRDVLKLNPEIITATVEKYKVSEGEAKFLLETVALLHDAGYPCVGCRAKSVHGISGADLVLPMRPMFDAMITSPNAQKEMLFHDFRNSILFHSADKIETAFTTKIVSTLGTFLADHSNVIQILSNFYDPSKNPSNIPRYALEIYVQNPDVRADIEKQLQESQDHFRNKAGTEIKLPEVKIHNGLFKGRFADLEYNKDKLLGLEFSQTDLLTLPFTMIRLVDNMDMCQTRLSPIQNELAFRKIYYELGNNQAISKIAIALENYEREVDKLKLDSTAKKEEIAQSVRETFKLLIDRTELSDPFVQKLLAKLTPDRIATLQTPKDARNLLNEALINTIFEEEQFATLPAEVKEEIRHIGMFQSSYDLRHFGGCEAVKNVNLVGIRGEAGRNIPHVVVTVDRPLFDKLNTIRVTEKTPTLHGFEQTIEVGVGEYQVWRANDAYRSLALGGTAVQLILLDENAKKIESTIAT